MAKLPGFAATVASQQAGTGSTCNSTAGPCIHDAAWSSVVAQAGSTASPQLAEIAASLARWPAGGINPLGAVQLDLSSAREC
jgi:hypothetical protein